MAPHQIHLICGSTGAGKTTYALRLCRALGAVRFSIDEWMATLFWPDSPQPIQADWAMQRVARCNAQIWDIARQVAGCGTPCVLDLGLGQKASRTDFVALAREAGLSVQLHYLEVSAEERWRRVQRRNAEKGPTYQLDFDITRDMFDFVESIFEPPDEAEMAAADGVRVG